MELPVWVVVLVVGGFFGSPLAMHWLVLRSLRVTVAAAMERSRRRNRRESSSPPPIRRRTERDGVVEAWNDDDTTDLHELEQLERKRLRAPRRPGERPPTRGSHHDR